MIRHKQHSCALSNPQKQLLKPIINNIVKGFKLSLTPKPLTCASSLALMLSATSQAATFQVTNLSDSGAGSLRQAILSANASAGMDIVNFDSSLSGQLFMQGGEIAITDDVQINGPTANLVSLRGLEAFRFFNIDGTAKGGIDVEISDLELHNGMVDDKGGAIVAIDTNLTIRNSIISANEARFFGGAIYLEQGELAVFDSTIISNVAGGGGGIFVNSHGSVTITNTDFISNFSDRGGALNLTGDAQGDIVISNSTFDKNKATSGGTGGAIFVEHDMDHPYELTISNSNFYNNQSTYQGGAIKFTGPGSITLNNSDFESNSTFPNYASGASVGSDGGAIFASMTQQNAHFYLNNTRFVSNASYSSGGALFLRADQTTDISVSGADVLNNRSSGRFGDGGITISLTSSASSVVISNTTISGNQAGYGAGGIAIRADASSADILVSNTSIINNSSLTGYGGGLKLIATDGFSGGQLLVSNTTIDGNSGRNGAGLHFGNPNGNQSLQINNSTISNNSSNSFGEFGAGDVWHHLVVDRVFEIPSDPGGWKINNRS